MSAPISTRRARSTPITRSRKRADAEAYLSRLSQYPAQLDGEVERIRTAREQGLVPPSFLLDKAIGQLTLAAKNARDGGSLVESLVRRTREKKIGGDWDERARAIVTKAVVPALERQIAELEAERAVATDVPGMWSRPHGDEYYRWALKASTTTNLTPDEVHAMGLEQLAELQGRMDPILKSLGYTQGTVGAAHAGARQGPALQILRRRQGPRRDRGLHPAAAGDEPRRLPRAFNTLVPGQARR